MVASNVTEQVDCNGRPCFMQDATPDIRDSFAQSIGAGSQILSERYERLAAERERLEREGAPLGVRIANRAARNAAARKNEAERA